jgi:hypothetical protein
MITFYTLLTLLFCMQDINQCCTSVSYIDILSKLDTDSKLAAQLYDKRDDLNLIHRQIFLPMTCSKIPVPPAYGDYIIQLIQHAKACTTYDQSLNPRRFLTNKSMVSTVSFTVNVSQIFMQ